MSLGAPGSRSRGYGALGKSWGFPKFTGTFFKGGYRGYIGDISGSGFPKFRGTFFKGVIGVI